MARQSVAYTATWDRSFCHPAGTLTRKVALRQKNNGIPPIEMQPLLGIAAVPESSAGEPARRSVREAEEQLKA